jgi:hypothetical protein
VGHTPGAFIAGDNNGSGAGGLGGSLSPGQGGGSGDSAAARAADGNYAGGGHAAGAGAGGGSFDEEGISRKGPGQISFGDGAGARAEDGLNPMGSPDPQDYFLRIGLKENLFVRVEKRYQKKQALWILGDKPEPPKVEPVKK